MIAAVAIVETSEPANQRASSSSVGGGQVALDKVNQSNVEFNFWCGGCVRRRTRWRRFSNVHHHHHPHHYLISLSTHNTNGLPNANANVDVNAANAANANAKRPDTRSGPASQPDAVMQSSSHARPGHAGTGAAAAAAQLHNIAFIFI